MKISSPKSLSAELEMMECAYQYEIRNNPHDYILDELSFPTNYPAVEKIITSGQLDSSSQFISFGDSNFGPPEIGKFNYGSVNCGGAMGVDRDKHFLFLISQSSDENQNSYLIGYEEESHGIEKAATMGRNEHVIAERRRRKKLTQKFVGLSALIPGLNKTDKASVLGGAIKYVKELQERLKWAEEEATDQKSVIKSVMFAKRINLSSDSDDETVADFQSDRFLR